MLRKLLIAVGVLLLIACAGGVWLTILAVNSALDAEKTLHAFRLVQDVTQAYCAEHPGQWPKSWDELETSHPSREPMWSWPEDQAEVSKRVTVDFSLQLEDVLRMDPNAFTAIVQREPHFMGEEEDARHFLAALRELQHSD